MTSGHRFLHFSNESSLVIEFPLQIILDDSLNYLNMESHSVINVTREYLLGCQSRMRMCCEPMGGILLSFNLGRWLMVNA